MFLMSRLPKPSSLHHVCDFEAARRVPGHVVAAVDVHVVRAVDEEAQPPHDSWQDITLEKMAVQVNRLDRVSITSAITMRHTTEMAGEVSIVRNSRAQRLSAKNFKSVAS